MNRNLDSNADMRNDMKRNIQKLIVNMPNFKIFIKVNKIISFNK